MGLTDKSRGRRRGLRPDRDYGFPLDLGIWPFPVHPRLSKRLYVRDLREKHVINVDGYYRAVQ